MNRVQLMEEIIKQVEKTEPTEKVDALFEALKRLPDADLIILHTEIVKGA